MCAKKTNKKQFVCAFCGLQMTTTLWGLERHEKIHAKYVERVKCLAEKCLSTFADKQKYFYHWKKAHRNIPMPDGLTIIHEPSKYSIKKTFKKEIQAEKSKLIDIPIDFAILDAVGLRRNVKIKVENAIKECLIRDPSYGQM